MFLYSTVTPNQIERLYSRFTSLDKNDCGTLSREDFLRIPELAINPLSERIVHSFFAESHDDRVNFLQFMRVLAHFRPIRKNRENKLNSRDEKLRCKYDRHYLIYATIHWFLSSVCEYAFVYTDCMIKNLNMSVVFLIQ